MTEQTQTTDNIEQLKAEFQQKKADYLAKESKLKGLESEKAKAEEMKAALENELQEIANKTQTAINADKFLTADQYAEMKSADFNLKAKIDYYQALIEELDERLYVLKAELFRERYDILPYRKDIFLIEVKPLIEQFKKNNADLLSDIYTLLINGGYSQNSTIQEINDIVESIINTDKAINSEYEVDNLIGDFRPQPTLRHQQKTLEEMGRAEPRGFKRLIKNLLK
ncbi:hypothetical protein [Lonepinella sp. BR2357]|uniref:hypothetical protein n=1 Tax=Lonepinella sp. BR2357 TaxID=3434549 RepID=UPI003F6DB928